MPWDGVHAMPVRRGQSEVVGVAAVVFRFPQRPWKWLSTLFPRQGQSEVHTADSSLGTKAGGFLRPKSGFIWLQWGQGTLP